MHSFKRVSCSIVAVALLTIFASSTFVHAQDATPAAACDASYGSDAGTVFTNASQAMGAGNLQAADYAKIGIDISKIRQAYEDMAAPAGCETSRKQIAQVSALDEDVVLLNLFARLDSKNATTYTDFIQNTFNPRFAAFKASLSATPAAEAPAGGTCGDADFQKKIPADFKNMGSPDMTSSAALGTSLLALLKLRYQYEDAAAPAGCELAKKDTVMLLAAAEDIVLVAAGGLADTANAATYTDFMSKTVNPRGQKLFGTLQTDLGIGTATPAATDAS